MGMRSLDDVLVAHGVAVRAADVVTALDSVLGQGTGDSALAPSPARLTRAESAFLDAHGGLPPPGPDRSAQARTLATVALEAIRGLSTREVADLLGVDESRVRHMVSEGRLYRLPTKVRRAHAFPDWQFADGRVLPHLHRVLHAVDSRLIPIEVRQFMLRPHDVLEVEGEPVSTRDWLLSGGSANPVVALAANLTS